MVRIFARAEICATGPSIGRGLESGRAILFDPNEVILAPTNPCSTPRSLLAASVDLCNLRGHPVGNNNGRDRMCQDEKTCNVITISVVLPNYNHGRFLQRAVDALMAQDTRPDEIIIIDDGSTDNSRDVI